MATNGLGCLIMTAVIDHSFRERLLAEPAEAIGDFDLTNDEQAALISIRAGSFTEFAARLYRWLEQRDPIHPGFPEEDGSSELGKGWLCQNSAEAEDSHAVSRTDHLSWGMRDSRPLFVEVSRSMQPRYSDKRTQFALLNEPG